jgi:acyl-CoA synthetase (AMP-forming)/AMP-acid ligase II
MDMNDPIAFLAVDQMERLARQRGQAELWVDVSGSRTWADLADGIASVRRLCSDSGVRPGEVVVAPACTGFDDLVWLFGISERSAIVAPLRAERAAETQAWKRWFEIGWRVDSGSLERDGGGETAPGAARLFAELRARGNPGLILATGGTTGKPKLVLHDLAALLATVPVRSRRPKRTLPLMRFDHIGGLDMAWRAMAGGHVLVGPPPEITAESVASTVERHRVEVMSATPSFLNLLLVAGSHRSHDLGSLSVVPYGAEPMPAALLERLHAALPHVEFVQRFGTSETGSVPVRNGASGLSLDDAGKGYEWKIVDGELWVRSPARALGYLTGETGGFSAEGWFRTGDVAEELGDGAINVRGRRQDVINMGGEKILPSEVEALLLSHPLVEDCRVFAVASALLGQVVAAEIVWTGARRDPVLVKQALREHVSGTEAQRRIPAVIRLVDSVGFTQNQKKSRAPTL